MLAWFLTLAITGILQILRYPGVIAAINPLHAVHFLISHGAGSLKVLGSVFLVATGAEALYADMGHFGRRPIALAWHGIVFPSLLLKEGFFRIIAHFGFMETPTRSSNVAR
jgi:KUP system potassium uptake protein